MLKRNCLYAIVLILSLSLGCHCPEVKPGDTPVPTAEPSPVVANQTPMVTETSSPKEQITDAQREYLENGTDCDWTEPDLVQPIYTDKHRTDGKILYVANCSNCHGMPGEGPTKYRKSPPFDPPARDLANFNAYNWGSEPKMILRSIAYGVEGTAMAPLADTLTSQEMWSIVAYLETFK